jgi:hypothetical protein
MENSKAFLDNYANDPEQIGLFFTSARKAGNLHAQAEDIRELRAGLDALQDPTFEDMRPGFEALLASPSLVRYFEDEVSCSLNSDIHQAQGQAIDNDAMQGLQIIDSQHYAIAVVVSDPTAIADKKHRTRNTATSVMMTPKDLLVRFIRAGGARITFYSCDEVNDANPARADMRCEAGRTVAVNDGDTFVLRAGRDSFSVESAESVVCFAQAYAKHSSVAVMPEFDSRTRTLIGLSATNDKSSRIQMMATILRLFGHDRAFEIAEPFASHEDYFVRWYVARELIAIDTERALPLIESMATNDPHPQVRETANRTLAMLRPAIAA